MPPISSSSWGKGAVYTALGAEFGSIVAAGVLLGSYVDGRLGTTPLFSLLLTVGGMVGAVYRLLWGLNKSRSLSDLGARSDPKGSGPAGPTPAAGPRSVTDSQPPRSNTDNGD